MADPDFDVVVLGAGSGGYACALRAAQLGLRVALVEKSRIGGTCLHVGCIPTKALLHAAEVADGVRTAGAVGVHATLDSIDMAAVHDYKDTVVRRLFKGLTGLVSSRGITMVEGEGRLTGPRTVDVAGRELTGRHVVLATGSRSRSLPGLDVDGERIVTSDQALALPRVPRAVIVVGGGVIGCEFASLWRSFGAEVTIVEALPRLLAGEDADSSRALERAFRRRGIDLRTETLVESFETTERGVRIHLADAESLEAELLLVAVGRGPASEGLGLSAQHIATHDGHVVVDEHCRTTVERVYAVGDLVAGPQLAHRGFQQGVMVAEQIAGLSPRLVPDTTIPRVTYTHPEVAAVGLDEETARERHGDDVVTFTYDLAGNGRSQILQTQGFVKVVALADGPVLGVHMVGDRVGELIGEAQLIHGWEAHAADVAPYVHAHPTQNEALGEAALALAGKALHAHT